jgi:hypothetical protein
VGLAISWECSDSYYEGENFTFSHVILFYSTIAGLLADSYLTFWGAEGLAARFAIILPLSNATAFL